MAISIASLLPTLQLVPQVVSPVSGQRRSRQALRGGARHRRCYRSETGHTHILRERERDRGQLSVIHGTGTRSGSFLRAPCPHVKTRRATGPPTWAYVVALRAPPSPRAFAILDGRPWHARSGSRKGWLVKITRFWGIGNRGAAPRVSSGLLRFRRAREPHEHAIGGGRRLSAKLPSFLLQYLLQTHLQTARPSSHLDPRVPNPASCRFLIWGRAARQRNGRDNRGRAYSGLIDIRSGRVPAWDPLALAPRPLVLFPPFPLPRAPKTAAAARALFTAVPWLSSESTPPSHAHGKCQDARRFVWRLRHASDGSGCDPDRPELPPPPSPSLPPTTPPLCWRDYGSQPRPYALCPASHQSRHSPKPSTWRCLARPKASRQLAPRQLAMELLDSLSQWFDCVGRIW